MKEVITMWRHTQMVVLVALSAAIYAAVLIPFKGFPPRPRLYRAATGQCFPDPIRAPVRPGGGLGGGHRQHDRGLRWRHPYGGERRWIRG